VCFIGHQRRRRWCSVTVSALATLAASIVLTGASPVTAVAAAQPNVVVIMVDDMNVSAFGVHAAGPVAHRHGGYDIHH